MGSRKRSQSCGSVLLATIGHNISAQRGAPGRLGVAGRGGPARRRACGASGGRCGLLQCASASSSVGRRTPPPGLKMPLLIRAFLRCGCDAPRRGVAPPRQGGGLTGRGFLCDGHVTTLILSAQMAPHGLFHDAAFRRLGILGQRCNPSIMQACNRAFIKVECHSTALACFRACKRIHVHFLLSHVSTSLARAAYSRARGLAASKSPIVLPSETASATRTDRPIVTGSRGSPAPRMASSAALW